ncbi:MAG: PEGA domain-containing protein [Planctomycetes bacterium]|nr:PEGA domain-containing protein [Planctomycetota bacterium]
MPARARSILLACLAAVLPACTYSSGRTTVLVTSAPAGAAIFVDGKDTGETTPFLLDLARDQLLSGYWSSDHLISVRKAGFEPEDRSVYHHRTHYTSRWIDGVTDSTLVSLPLWWTFGDWFTPFGIRWDYVPHELHVKLYPLGEAPGQKKRP